jgi:hypothetical protein
MLTLTIGHPFSANYGSAIIMNPPCNQEKYSNKSAKVCGACWAGSPNRNLFVV